MYQKMEEEGKRLMLWTYFQSDFKRVSGGINKKLPIKSDEESSLVDYTFEPSAQRS